MRRGLVGALAGISLFVASSAFAQQAVDTVELRSGGVVKGTIVELLPGDHVTIQLPSGMKTFSWGEISRVERAGSQPQVQGPVYTAPPAAAAYSWTGCYLGVAGGGAWGRSDHIVNGRGIQIGDIVLGLASTGLHSNGYSLGAKSSSTTPA